MMPRFVAIDYGQKRTGLAVGDDITGLVQPYEVLSVAHGEPLYAALTKAIDEIGPDAIVVGLPLNMDGSEGPAAKAARDFGAVIAERTRLPVDYQDERLSSFSAETQLAGTGRTRKEKRELRDALAAAEILREYLADRGAVPFDDPD